MTHVFELVTEFHKIFGHSIGTEPTVDVPESALRIKMINSEFIELFDAAFLGDKVEMADGLGDIAYLVEGSALVWGLGPVELVKYGSEVGVGNLSLYLHHTFLLLIEAVNTQDVEYVRVLLSVIKSVCYSMADKLGYDLDEVIAAIHKSNLTKLGEDGKPIYILEGDEAGKVAKGPNYVTPTADITEILSRSLSDARA